jgi:hypothetical protein
MFFATQSAPTGHSCAKGKISPFRNKKLSFIVYWNKGGGSMKNLMFLLSLCLLLTGCASPSAPAEEIVPPTCAETPGEANPTCGPGVPYRMTCRIVDGAESGHLLLAEYSETVRGIYTLSMDSLTFEPQFTEPLRNGQLIDVYYGAFTESWPMNFGGVTAIEIVNGGFDDRCVLYLDVLEDLWDVDSSLNDGVEVIGVDLSQTSLSPAEQAAVSWVFAGNHGAELAEGSVADLVEQGWITATPLSISGSGIDLTEPQHYFYEWKNGCHFSIKEHPVDGTYSLTPVTFDAQKWRSSLGAYFFCDCTALQSPLGEWSEYQIGTEAIS